MLLPARSLDKALVGTSAPIYLASRGYAWLTSMLRDVFPSGDCYDSLNSEWWQLWHLFFGEDASFTSSSNQLPMSDYSSPSPIRALQPCHPNSTDLSANERCGEIAAYGTDLSSETGPDSRYVFPPFEPSFSVMTDLHQCLQQATSADSSPTVSAKKRSLSAKKHSVAKTKPFPCGQCLKDFSHPKNLRRHGIEKHGWPPKKGGRPKKGEPVWIWS